MEADIFRGTNYRGVTRNFNTMYQILVQCNGQRHYVGTLDNRHKAAVLHDIVVIQSKGLKAKTNFCYTKVELIALMSIGNLKTSLQ